MLAHPANEREGVYSSLHDARTLLSNVRGRGTRGGDRRRDCMATDKPNDCRSDQGPERELDSAGAAREFA
jgi:hypothetical protein